MHIIIPMSGTGQRFIKAGYKTPKPLIKVDDKPMIEHVVNLFPGETKITFICNKDHLATTNMANILQNIAPTASIIEIEPHKKGPVYAVAQMFENIDDHEEVIVNYCDFSTLWNYQDFLKAVRSNNADGAIPAYRNFHPHMLGATNYAFIKEENKWFQAIKEKEPFTDNRMQEFASNGTYYFKKGSYVKKYFSELMNQDINLKGEYYVSLVYNLMHHDDLKTYIYEVDYMLQWGTPQDLQEYQKWSDCFRDLKKPQKKIQPQPNSINLIPMAGRGQRFAQEGYQAPKPLIPVTGKPMIIQAACMNPPAENHIFVCLEEHLQQYPDIKTTLKSSYPHSSIIKLDEITQGQACSCEVGLKDVDLEAPLFIGACDNGMLWNQEKYQTLISDESVDAIAFSFRNHPASTRNPQMYGWLNVDEDDTVTGVSVKKSISNNPAHDHAIVGAFYFRKVRYFLESLQYLYEKNVRINNEFYVDSCIGALVSLGKNVKVFEIDHYMCWGTPNDYRTFNYWQKFFNECWWHAFQKPPSDFQKQSALSSP